MLSCGAFCTAVDQQTVAYGTSLGRDSIRNNDRTQSASKSAPALFGLGTVMIPLPGLFPVEERIARTFLSNDATLGAGHRKEAHLLEGLPERLVIPNRGGFRLVRPFKLPCPS
jgi:hypothetical protein